jgi:hypothetical protein
VVEGGAMNAFSEKLLKEQNGGGGYGTETCLSAALRYADELDFAVFPVPPGTKKSHKKAKFSDGVNWGATKDPEQIKRDFKKWPKANVGIPTGAENGFFVVEADTKEGHDVDGIANLQALIDANSPLPETRMAKSPTGSIHYYFSYPAEGEVINSSSKLAPGVDIRGEGGMVVAPPSVKPDVGIYEWLSEADIADAPQWLLDRVIKKEVERDATSGSKTKADLADIAKEMMLVPNLDEGWDDWNTKGLAIYDATGGSAEGLALFNAWSMKSKKYQHDAVIERWTNYHNCPPTEIDGTEAIRNWAKKASEQAKKPLPPGAQHIAQMLPWRERRASGFPVPSFYNVRLGIPAMGIECRHDLFRNVTIIGFKGDKITHEIKLLIGELSNATLLRLRHLFSDRYCFDPEDKNILDAVMSLAYENCFDPILDMLAEAEGNWDGVKRLDNWVAVYLGCEDTPLNRAIGRKMLIAAARRPRVPGCKFDNITVLEGLEGKNKSTAIRILAGDDFFSDQSILGVRDKEVQEQLSGIWMHESADLAGMRKADDLQMKAFASRQVDRARPAYGRVRENIPRRSIEWGTTNDSEYLKSQTGNRRFWPLATGRIDIEALKRDRLQLLGEAAKYESDGESLTLDETLWPDAMEAQEKRRSSDAWEIKLAELSFTDWLFAKGSSNKTIVHFVGNQKRVSTLTILENVLGIVHAKDLKPTDTMRLSNVMRALGWEKSDNKIWIDGKQVRGFFCEWIDQDLLDAIRMGGIGGSSKDPADTCLTMEEATAVAGVAESEANEARLLKASGKPICWYGGPELFY